MNRKCVGISLIVLTVLSLACIEQKPKVIESARIDILEKIHINIDGLSSDWEGIAPIYKDSEKSMFAAIDEDYIVIRMDFVDLMPIKENYFLGIDINFDEITDYRIELNTRDRVLSLEKNDSGEWKEIKSELEGFALRIVEIKAPLAVLDGEGFFLTGWIYDNIVKNVTSHFPWIRSLYPETGFDPEKLTKSEWKEDFEALYYIVKYNYPYLWVKERIYGYNWLDLKEYYMERLNEIETNEEFLDLIREAVQSLQNGHTMVFNYKTIEFWRVAYSDIITDEVLEANRYWEEKWEYSCPEVFFCYIEGEYIAIGGIDNWKEKYGIEEGSKVIEVNNIDVDEAVNSIIQKTHVQQDRDKDKLFVDYLDPNFFGENTIFTIKNPDGNTVRKSIQCNSEESWRELFTLIYGGSNSPFEFRKWEDKKTAYIKVRTFPYGKLEEDRPILLDFYRTIKDYDTLIIDIRGNLGGNTSYGIYNILMPLIKNDTEVEFFTAFRQGKYANWQGRKDGTRLGYTTLKDTISNLPPEVRTNNFVDLSKNNLYFKRSETAFNGDVYLLVDRWVHSAAETFASLSKTSGFAKLVGTTTGGDGLCFTAMCFVLPNSKIVIWIWGGMGINPDGTANEETHTTPDIYFEFGEWKNDEELIEYLLENVIDQSH